MGAVPKKRPSATRRNTRKSAWEKKHAQNSFRPIIVCDNCGQTKEPHRACLKCGFYRGNKIMEPKTSVKRVQS